MGEVLIFMFYILMCEIHTVAAAKRPCFKKTLSPLQQHESKAARQQDRREKATCMWLLLAG